MNLSNTSKKLILLLLLVFGIGISIYAFIPKTNIFDYIYEHFNEVYADYQIDQYPYDYCGDVNSVTFSDDSNNVKVEINRVNTFHSEERGIYSLPNNFLHIKFEYKYNDCDYRFFLYYVLIDKNNHDVLVGATKKMLKLEIDTHDPTFLTNQEERIQQAFLLCKQYITNPVQQLTNKFRHKVGKFNSIYIDVFPSDTCYTYQNKSWKTSSRCPLVI